MAKLYYQGHGSFRITADCGKVIYVDPYAGDGYDLAADLILVTHAHEDHNCVHLIENRAEGCTLITEKEALAQGKHQSFDLGWVQVTAVKAQNKNHDPAKCVGYVITLDGTSVYAAGDTSRFDEMADLAAMQLDWALLPTDGQYNMGPEEAAECAALIGAKHTVPIHTDPYSLYDAEQAARFTAPNRVFLRPGETLPL